MTLDECIIILKDHNNWRRALAGYEPTDPRVLGVAIDYAIEELHRLKGLEK